MTTAPDDVVEACVQLASHAAVIQIGEKGWSVTRQQHDEIVISTDGGIQQQAAQVPRMKRTHFFSPSTFTSEHQP